MSDVTNSPQATSSWLSKCVTIKTEDDAVSFINKTHLSGLQKALYNFYKSGKFCDVSVNCYNGSYQAHSVILASGCSFLDKELETGEEEIYLPENISAVGFEPVLEYFYTGTLKIYEDAFDLIKTTAEILELKAVSAICVAYSKINSKGKFNVGIKNFTKNESDKSVDKASISKQLNLNKDLKVSVVSNTMNECAKNIIPESLRSSLSVSVTTSSSISPNITKSQPKVKRLNSGLEIIPISSPSDAKRGKNNDPNHLSSNPKFEMYMSESDYSDEDFSDLDEIEEELIMRKMGSNGSFKVLKEKFDDDTDEVPKPEELEEDENTK